MFKYYFQKIIDRMLAEDYSAQKLALTMCCGLFIALSPFLGLQTPLAIGVGWLFGLPIGLLIIVIYTVNNPFITMVPILLANYLAGIVIFDYMLPCAALRHNPAAVEFVLAKIRPTMEKYLGIEELYFWYFIVGGTLFALLCSFPFYWFWKSYFSHIMLKYKGIKERETIKHNENNNAKP